MTLTSRACLACYGFAAIFTALSARLVYLSVNQHEKYSTYAQETYQGKVYLPARRGAILDARGAVLARNEPQKNVIADGSLLVYEKKEGKPKRTVTVDLRPRIAALLAEPLGMKAEEIVEKIKPGNRYVVLKNKISEETASEIERRLREFEKQRSEELKRPVDEIRGIHFEPNFERVYPEKQLASHIVGFFGFEEMRDKEGKVSGRFKGIEGIERSMDDWLSGKDGWRCFEKDGRGREVVASRTEVRAPVHGANVQLTVDLGLQQIVETELEAAFKKYRPIKASAVMMNPYTGEIMSLANRPCYDPNEPGGAKPEQRFNHAVAGIYEPGSTMKVMTCAGGLNYRKVKLDTQIWCENGTWNYGGKPLRDHHPYGSLTVTQIVEKSSNIGAAKIAIGMGEEAFHGWLRSFGFGQATNIALPGEARGILAPRDRWSGISITRLAMGHEVAVTPLQLVTAVSAIANGGNLMMPQLLKRISDDANQTIREYQPQVVRSVLAPDVAQKVTEALTGVTTKKGTASRAHIPGYRTAGKTGTTQKYDPITKLPSRSKHVTSFVGFVPAEKPAFCLIITLDEAQVPSNEDTGGMITAPVFKAIAEKALVHLGVQPDPVLLQDDLAAEKKLAKNNP